MDISKNQYRSTGGKYPCFDSVISTTELKQFAISVDLDSTGGYLLIFEIYNSRHSGS